MKKYLITGAMALVAGFYLTSCTHDDVGYDNLYEEKTQSFEKVFKDLYGTIDPNHDWGFTPYVVDDNTTTASAGTRALTRGAYPNANDWAGEGWNVPDPLHEDQIAIVRKYFQQFKDPVDEPITYSDFFVQDVYKGGTLVDQNSKTTETCYSAYGDPNNPIYGSNQMDQLSAGMGDHISNYNHAQCSPNYNVSSATIGTHEDKIMLMTGSSTAYFGYNNSLQSSYKYNDMFTRVSGNTIMKWARENNISVPSTGDVTGMHFVGFDYEADLSHGLTDNMQGNSYLVTEVPAGTAGAFQIPNKQNDGDWQKGKWYIAGARDHYYSDWIVRIIPGTKRDTSNDKDKEKEQTTNKKKYKAKRHLIAAIGRVFVEDLYNANRADIDYNDAVFDAIIWKESDIVVNKNLQDTIESESNIKYNVEIALLAAGGTIPMTIAGSKFGDVHTAFGVGLTTIVNTVGEASNVFGSTITGKEYVYKKFDYTEELSGKSTISLNDIPIDVEWITGDVKVAARLNNKETRTYLKDENGRLRKDDNGDPIIDPSATSAPVVPHVIQVPIGTAWPQERVNIGLANEGPYHLFPNYVEHYNDYKDRVWVENVDNFYLYQGNRTPLAYGGKDKDFVYLTNIEWVEGTVIWQGSQDFWNWGEPKASITPKDVFKNYKVGQKIRLYGDIINPNNSWSLQLFSGMWDQGHGMLFEATNVNDNGFNQNGYVELTIDQDLYTILTQEINWGVACNIQGDNFRLQYVTIVD